MEFEFVTDTDSVMQILKLWNSQLLESIPPSCSQPEFETTPTISTKHSLSKERWSFLPFSTALVSDNDKLEQARSFLGTGTVDSEEEDSPSRYSSGSDIEYFDEAPGCSCEKPCSVYTVSSRRCPKPTNTKVGIVTKRIGNQATRGALLPEEKVDSEEEDYTEQFEKETKQMRVRFAELVDDVSNSLEKRNVTTDRAVLFLQNVHPVLKSRIDDMTKASNMDQVLTIVTDQACSWFDYEIIKDLVDKFGVDGDRKLLSEYEAKFKEFAEQRTLPNGKKHIEVGSGARKGGKQLVVKIDKEWNEINFKDLDKICNSLASILNVKRRDLYLADVREGCVMMTFMITEELAETLFPNKNDLTSSKLSSYFSSSQLKLLQDEGIILLTCGKVSWRWRPAMDQSLPEPQEKSLKPLDSHPDSLLDRQKLESLSPLLSSPKEASDTEQSTCDLRTFGNLKRKEFMKLHKEVLESVMERDKLVSWLLESIPPSCSQPECKATPTISTKHSLSLERQSFWRPYRQRFQFFFTSLVSDNDNLKQAGSFSKIHTFGSGQQVPRAGAALSGQRSWGSSNSPPVSPSVSQLLHDSVFNSLTLLPPLPPRPEESDSDDPNYSYIDEIMVKGPESQRGRSTSGVSGVKGRVSSPTLDNQLRKLKSIVELDEDRKKLRDEEFKKWHDEELKKSTMKRDKVANQTGRKAATLHSPPRSSSRSRLPMNFAQAEPEDYLEPAASKRLTSTSLEGVPKRDKLSPNIDNLPQSLSDHSDNVNNSSSLSIETAPGEVLDNDQLPSDAHNNSAGIGNISNVNSGAVGGMIGPGGNPPALPPRPQRKGSVTSVSSVSSATAPSNSSVAPFTNPPPAARGLSISEGTSIIEKEKCSILGSPKESRQASNADQSAVMTIDANTRSHSEPRRLSTLTSLGSWKTTNCTMPPSAGGMAPGVGGPPPGAAFHNRITLTHRRLILRIFAHHLNRNGDR